MGHNIVGRLSGRNISLPDVNPAPRPELALSGVMYNGQAALGVGEFNADVAYPDVAEFRRKFGLLIPVTNTSMEHELWSIIGAYPGPNGLAGIGLHTANVVTPKPQLRTAADLEAYKQQFLGGLACGSGWRAACGARISDHGNELGACD